MGEEEGGALLGERWPEEEESGAWQLLAEFEFRLLENIAMITGFQGCCCERGVLGGEES